MRKSLLGGLDVGATKNQDLQLLSNISKTTAPKQMRGNVTALVEQIKVNVQKFLGKYKDNVTALRQEQDVSDYIDKAIKFGFLAIDTETTGLNPLQDKVVGSCLYVPGEKAVYIPHYHKSYITGSPLNNQISYEFMGKQYQRLVDNNVKLIFHNAKFDMRMIRSNFGVRLQPYWDTMIGAKLLNNLESAALKYQYATHIKGEEKEYDFSTLFDKIDYTMVPVDTATLYAATDPLITYELYEYQIKAFKDVPRTYNLFINVEMPLIEVVADMEDTGVALDFNYAKQLSVKYNEMLKQSGEKIAQELEKYKTQISVYKSRYPACKLEYPVNISSPTQLAILLYDVLQVPVIDQKKPRGTSEEILEQIDLPLCKLILEYRGLEKLVGTYIDKMPAIVDPKDRRVHASFNQIGADTGRFSSSDPNLQNIPSHNTDIRKMFSATDGYYLLGSDYSQQEPKLLAFYTQDADMMAEFDKDDPDLYAQVASMSFDKPYEDCREFYPAGTEITVNGKKVITGYKTHTNKEGKERRTQAKSILLG